MTQLMEQLMQARVSLANVYDQLRNGLAWYKDEMEKLKAQLVEKDKEIERLKKELNEKSSG